MTTIASNFIVKEGGIYGDLELSGSDPSKMQDDVAWRVMIPEGDTAEFGYVKIRDCGLPLRHDSGFLKINTLDCKRFTADLFNSHGDLDIENLVVDYDGTDFTAEDYEGYHPDALGQFFCKSKDEVKNVRIHNIYARIKGELIQGMMLSEGNDYSGFSIGGGDVDIKIDYPYAFVANTLKESDIDVGDNGVKVQNVKCSDHQSCAVVVKRHSELQTIVTDFEEHQALPTTQIPVGKTLAEYALELGVDHAMLEAIRQKESKGRCFYGSGSAQTPSNLHERHIAYDCLIERGENPAQVIRDNPALADVIAMQSYARYGSFATQVKRFDLLSKFDRDVAIMSSSFGGFQVLGKNWQMCGFTSAEDFYQAMQTKDGQLFAFIGYLKGCNGLIEALRAKDFPEIKRLYNGPRKSDKDGDGQDDYTAELMREYTRAVQRLNPRKNPVKSETLRNVGYDVLVKAVTGGGLLVGANDLSGVVVGTVTKATAVVESVQDQAAQVADKIDAGRAAIDKTVETVAMVGDKLHFTGFAGLPLVMLYLLGGLILLSVFFNLRAGWRYLIDNGYALPRFGFLGRHSDEFSDY